MYIYIYIYLQRERERDIISMYRHAEQRSMLDDSGELWANFTPGLAKRNKRKYPLHDTSYSVANYYHYDIVLLAYFLSNNFAPGLASDCYFAMSGPIIQDGMCIYIYIYIYMCIYIYIYMYTYTLYI